MKNGSESTPLLESCKKGRRHISYLLLKWGAVTNARDGRNRTPLNCAIFNGHAALVAALQARGAVAAIDAEDSDDDDDSDEEEEEEDTDEEDE